MPLSEDSSAPSQNRPICPPLQPVGKAAGQTPCSLMDVAQAVPAARAWGPPAVPKSISHAASILTLSLFTHNHTPMGNPYNTGRTMRCGPVSGPTRVSDLPGQAPCNTSQAPGEGKSNKEAVYTGCQAKGYDGLNSPATSIVAPTGQTGAEALGRAPPEPPVGSRVGCSVEEEATGKALTTDVGSVFAESADAATAAALLHVLAPSVHPSPCSNAQSVVSSSPLELHCSPCNSSTSWRPCARASIKSRSRTSAPGQSTVCAEDRQTPARRAGTHSINGLPWSPASPGAHNSCTSLRTPTSAARQRTSAPPRSPRPTASPRSFLTLTSIGGGGGAGTFSWDVPRVVRHHVTVHARQEACGPRRTSFSGACEGTLAYSPRCAWSPPCRRAGIGANTVCSSPLVLTSPAI